MAGVRSQTIPTNVCVGGVIQGPRPVAVLERGRKDMLSAVKPGIDGPLSGPDQRQHHAEHRQCNGNNSMGRQGKGRPRHHNSRDGNPQADNEQQAGQRSNDLRRRNSATRCGGDAVQQSSADQQPLNQKPGARPAACERGEEPLHKNPVLQLRE
jgi:hypothetical protein